MPQIIRVAGHSCRALGLLCQSVMAESGKCELKPAHRNAQDNLNTSPAPVLSVDDCAFCMVVNGQTEVEQLYADEFVVAFLHIAPLCCGHALIVPRQHTASLSALAPPLHAHLLQIAAEIGSAMMHAANCDGYNLWLANGSCAGQDVEHLCMHVLPRGVDDALLMPVDDYLYGSETEKKHILQIARQRMEK